MNEHETTAPESLPVAGQVERQVRPRAWALFAPNGNYRIWSTVREEVERLAAEAGAPVTPLYDQDALDAAVAAERERCASMAENYDLGTPEGHGIARCIRGA